jgi:hypothetical protein
MEDKAGALYFLPCNVEERDLDSVIPIVGEVIADMLASPKEGNYFWDLALGYGIRCYARLLNRTEPSLLSSAVPDLVELLSQMIFSSNQTLQGFGLAAATFDAPRHSHKIEARLRRELAVQPSMYCPEWHEASRRCLRVLKSTGKRRKNI